MKLVRKQALKLRLQGQSYNEINATLGVPKSTLSGWFRRVTLPASAQVRLQNRVAQGTLNGLVRRNKLQTPLAQKRAATIRLEAKKEFTTLSKDKILLLGVALYWAEGYKRPKMRNGRITTSHSIALTNADPDMIAFFVYFLLNLLHISTEKIRLNLRLFKHIHANEAIKFWSNVTGLKTSNFERPSFVVSKSSRGKRPYQRLPYGTIQVRVNDTAKFYQLMGWIDGIIKALKQNLNN